MSERNKYLMWLFLSILWLGFARGDARANYWNGVIMDSIMAGVFNLCFVCSYFHSRAEARP
jgi:hypothetical protein